MNSHNCENGKWYFSNCGSIITYVCVCLYVNICWIIYIYIHIHEIVVLRLHGSWSKVRDSNAVAFSFGKEVPLNGMLWQSLTDNSMPMDPFHKGFMSSNSKFWKIIFAVIMILMIRSYHKFAHVTTAQLSWHAQNCDQIASLFFM